MGITRQSHITTLWSGGRPVVLRMKLLVLCLLTCLVAVCQSDSAISDCSVKCSSDCQCPCQSVNTKPLWKYTKMRGKGKNKKPVADAPCVFDPSGDDKCGRCINGGQQCGFPMQKWCQNPKSKKGCPGVPNNKYTKSTIGGPCYWDPSDLSCAVCTNGKMKQCAQNGVSTKCGHFCSKATDRKCDGNLFNCVQINPMCAAGASCVVNEKNKRGQCVCAPGTTGLGFNSCFYGNGTIVSNPEETVEISLDTKSKYFIYTNEEL